MEIDGNGETDAGRAGKERARTAHLGTAAKNTAETHREHVDGESALACD